MAGLEAGGCRHLKRLNVEKMCMGPRGGQAVARALASGYLSGLVCLDMSNSKDLGDEVMALVIRTLQACHQLQYLVLRETGMEQTAGQALVRGCQEGSLRRLVMVNISYNPAIGDAVIGYCLHRALATGSLPRLERVYLRMTGVSEGGLRRFFGVIEEGACPALRAVGVDWCDREWDERLGERGVLIDTSASDDDDNDDDEEEA